MEISSIVRCPIPCVRSYTKQWVISCYVDFLWDSVIMQLSDYAVVIRIQVLRYEPGGRRFESFRARHIYM